MNVLFGYLGDLSLGHAAFVGIGAYVTAILSTRYGVPTWIGLLAAIPVSALFGAVFGYLSLRVVGPQFTILTLAFGSILYTVANYWIDVTRGPFGISGIPHLRIAGFTFDTAVSNFYLVLAVLIVVSYACWALMNSRTGRAFSAVRENLPLAESVGIDARRTRIFGFTIAAVIAGIGGALYGFYIQLVTPELMSVSYVVTLLIMVIVGGRGRILGAIVGALIFVLLIESLRAVGEARMVIFALLLMGAVAIAPGGLVTILPRLLERFRSRAAHKRNAQKAAGR
jgi:branched-chain amino acid transport system permease protein